MKNILNQFWVIVTLLFVLPSLCYGALTDSYFYEDWIENPGCSSLCGGYYQETPLPFPLQAKTVLDNQAITITSDSGEFIQQGPTTLTGHVHLIQGNRQLYTDKAIVYSHAIHHKIEHIKALGDVKIVEPGLRLEGSNATYTVAQDTIFIENVHFRLYRRHARGSAKNLIACKKNTLLLEDASYTSCAPYQNTWHLNAKKILLNKITGRGEAFSAKMYMKDIPIFYLPYINFPIDDRRKTGFLYPDIDMTNQSGLEFSTPFYWNMAPNYDTTLIPRYLSKRGLELGGIFRFLGTSTGGELQGYILPNDRAYKVFKEKNLNNHPNYLNNDPRVTGLNTGNTRTCFKTKQTATFNPNLAANFNYQSVSDDNYFIDFGNNIAASDTTQLLQRAEILYQDCHWSGIAKLEQYQTLHPFNGPLITDPYRKVPQIAFQSLYPDLPMNLYFTLAGDVSRFLHNKDPFTGKAFTTGERYYLRPSLFLPIICPAYYIKPRVQLYYLTYSLRLGETPYNTNQTKKPSLLLPMLDIDSTIFFERELFINHCCYTQTLEPRVYYLFVPYKNQNDQPNFDTNLSLLDFNQIFRDNRFNGLDRLGDANQMTLSLTTRLLQTNTGSEKASIGIGQIIYFRNQKVTIFNSQIIPRFDPRMEMYARKKMLSSFFGLVRYHLYHDWKLTATLEWDPYYKSSDKETLTLQYRPQELTVLNLGYQFLRKNPANINLRTGLPNRLEQSDISFAYKASEQWRFLGRWHYDIHNHVTNDILLGIEQEGCCTAIRFAVTRYLLPNNTINRRYNNRFHIQFIFKGFAGVGNNNMSEAFSRAIPGYVWREGDF